MQSTPISNSSEFASNGPQSTIDLLALFWRRRPLLIGFTLLGIALGVLYGILAEPVYESAADVLVVQKRPQAVTGDNQYESAFEDYLATHLAVMVSPLIVERAIEASDLGSLESFADLEFPEEDLVETIIAGLEIEGGSRDLGDSADTIMTLAFRGPVSEDCPLVVQALLDSYEDFHHELYRGMSDNTVGLIRQASDLLENDLAQQEETYSEFRQSSPLVARGTDEVNPLQDRLTTIEVQRSELLLRRSEIALQLLALEQAKKDGGDSQTLMTKVTELRQQARTESNVPNVSTALENQLIQLIDDEQKLMVHYGPNHPHVLTVRQRISDTRRFLALPTAIHVPQRDAGDESETTTADQDPVAVYTLYLQQELERLKISEGLLTELYDNEHEAAKEHSIFQLKDESYRRGIERTESLYDVVVNRLQEASLIKDFGGFETRVIAPPRLGTKVAPSSRIVLPVAAFAGIFLGCLLAVVFELRNDSFHSCEQIQQTLGLPVVGQIPQFVPAPKSVRRAAATDIALDPMLCAYYGPRSLPAESFRALRTALYFTSLDESSRVIQVTGPSVGDGASTVAANLAISLAQTGKRVLLIDADLSRQRQLEIFGLAPPKTGLAEIIASDVEPVEAICQTAVDNLWLLPAGPLAAGPCELFTSPRFGELVNLFRDSYDYVLIDTEPLLAASDPSVIAAQADGVVLALSLARDSRRRAKRATQMLARFDAKALGIVINRMSGAIRRRNQMERRDYRRARTRDNRPRPRREQSVG